MYRSYPNYLSAAKSAHIQLGHCWTDALRLEASAARGEKRQREEAKAKQGLGSASTESDEAKRKREAEVELHVGGAGEQCIHDERESKVCSSDLSSMAPVYSACGSSGPGFGL